MPDLTTLGNDSGWLANLIQIATYLGLPSLSAVVAWLWRDRQLAKRTREQLVATVNSMSEEMSQLRRKLTEARSRDPHEWLETYRQLADRHAAINHVRNGLARTAEPLHETFLLLAKYHEDLYPQHGHTHLLEARRMARIAALLNPAHKESIEQLALVDAIVEIEAIKSDTYDPGATAFDLPDIEPLTQDLAVAYVSRLLALAIRTIHAGDGVTYELITRHARGIAMKYLPADDGLMLNARQLWAESLAVNKLVQQAHAEVEHILPIMKATMAANDRRLMELLLLEGNLLIALGDATGVAKAMAAAKPFDELKELTQPYGDFAFPPSIEIPDSIRAIAIQKLGQSPASFKDDKK